MIVQEVYFSFLRGRFLDHFCCIGVGCKYLPCDTEYDATCDHEKISCH